MEIEMKMVLGQAEQIFLELVFEVGSTRLVLFMRL